MFVSLPIRNPRCETLTFNRVIHRSDYHKVLWDTAKDLGVELSLGADVVQVNYDETGVTLRSGEILSADIVIGADGKFNPDGVTCAEPG